MGGCFHRAAAKWRREPIATRQDTRHCEARTYILPRNRSRAFPPETAHHPKLAGHYRNQQELTGPDARLAQTS